ncbi:rod shape-determining protein MreC [sediment metagenome]|uniref:Cell shape-determining protein MreC n=1 Tax=sediment metagenome TaxID=749907 RepID=D9PKU5_9ZZZZ
MLKVSSRDYLVAFLLTGMVLLLNLTPVVPMTRSRFLAVTSPLQLGFTTLGKNLSQEISFWKHVREISNNSLRVARENVELQAKLSALTEVSRENEVLRTQLGLTAENAPKLMMARVLSSGGVETSALLLIDRGKKDGVVLNGVVVSGGHLVGKIIEVNEETSFVRLILDDDLKVAALDQDSPDRARGVVRGQFSRLMMMDKILKEERVEIGDTIITSGEDAVFPKGLVIGVVRQVESGPEGLLKEATLESLLKLNRLEEVFILEKS